ncbi:MAG TPA: amidase [Candidatus Acidoferrales bacterium]|nr:amidase [Candidatus Acidoferrales bacterium]
MTSLSASEMAAAVRRREILPTELLEAHLERIGRLDRQLNAFAYVDLDGARRQARAADAVLTNQGPLGPLHGVPISIKCSIDVAGWPCDCGSRLRAAYVAENDATLVTRLRDAGAILLGNTNAPELLMAYETDNSVRGKTNNPWDLRRTPGGSSGGEAAAIAARCSAGGVGSDGGGSIRVPAHYSGICGLKPTPGRIPATGHFPVSSGPFALLGVVGPMARTVSDLEMLFEVMAGLDYSDPSSAPVPVRWPDETKLERLRVGFFEEDGMTPVTPETRAAVRNAASALNAAGMTVEKFLPDGLPEARRLWWNLFGRAGEAVLEPFLKGQESQLSPTLVEFMGVVRKEPRLTVSELMNTLLARDDLRCRFLRQMERCPILLSPVCAIPAFQHGEREWTVEGRRVDYLQAMSYSQWFNLLGNPAVAVPVARSPEGLPIGVQVIGRPFEEEIVLAAARKIEKACEDPREPNMQMADA